MDFETMAQIWREQDSRARLQNEAELLHRLQSDYECRNKKLIWLNLQEGIPCLVLAVMSLSVGLNINSGGWAFLTAAGLFLGVGIFLTAVSIRHRASEPPLSDAVRRSVELSLAQVRHREWLYRNIAWWYLLPIVVGWGAIVYEKMLRNGIGTFAVTYVGFGLAFFLFVGWLNWRIAVRHYRPQCEQLERMLQQLTDDQTSSSS